MRVVVLGGLGFIGSSIARRLVSEDEDVVVADNQSTNITTEICGAEILRLDMTDRDAVEAAAAKIGKADAILQLSGPSSGPGANKAPLESVVLGYTVTFNALEMARRLGVSRFVNASSMVVYGNLRDDENPVTEDHACMPIGHYAIGKFANERLVDVVCSQEGIGFNSLRLFNVYGPGQDLGRSDQGVVSIFLSLLMKSTTMESRGSLDRYRDLIHIDDMVEAWVRAARGSPEDGAINVGTGHSMTYKDLIHIIADELGILDRLKVEIADGTPGDLFGICADIAKMKRALGFVPKWEIETGVRSYVRWAHRN